MSLTKRIINVKVQAHSSREEVIMLGGEEYRVYTRKPALEGKANKAVMELLAEYFGVPRSAVTLRKGEHSRNKTFSITI